MKSVEKAKVDKKELIRRAAVRVMAAEGYYNTSISQIADEAGVAVGTIYNYFEHKEDILEYIFAVELKKRIACLEDLQSEDGKFWDEFIRFLRFHFSDLRENPDTAMILIREKEFPCREDSGAISGYRRQISAKLAEMLKQGMAAGELKDYNIDVLTAVIFGALQGTVERAVQEKDFSLLDKAPEEIINLLLKGIGVS
ncbi:MAG: TetR/AcrR family transcriptional regulator [Halanaerobiaceae bacterium]